MVKLKNLLCAPWQGPLSLALGGLFQQRPGTSFRPTGYLPPQGSGPVQSDTIGVGQAKPLPS